MNFLPFTVYERLGIVELKPQKVILQLANRFTRLSREMVEYLLTKMGEFIFSVDFVALEIEVVAWLENRSQSYLPYYIMHMMQC